MVVISDDLTHDKFSTWTYLEVLITYLKEEIYIKNLAIFSDGCASQFKNRYVLSNLPDLELIHGFNITWSFFATSHGKGAVDGIGGIVKRCVWNKIKSRQVEIESAKAFANCASIQTKNIKTFYVEKERIQHTREVLEEKWSAVQRIPNLLSMHYFAVEDNVLLVSPTKNSAIITKMSKK